MAAVPPSMAAAVAAAMAQRASVGASCAAAQFSVVTALAYRRAFRVCNAGAAASTPVLTRRNVRSGWGLVVTVLRFLRHRACQGSGVAGLGLQGVHMVIGALASMEGVS
jgi:hypothetical protein